MLESYLLHRRRLFCIILYILIVDVNSFARFKALPVSFFLLFNGQTQMKSASGAE